MESAASTILSSAYTAFGELRSNRTNQRYGYTGTWGYQGTLDDAPPPSLEFPFLHVGHRYYDPGTGRFLQRDPIGSRGGLNVYDYAAGNPVAKVDPRVLIPDQMPPHMWPPSTHKRTPEERAAQAKGMALGCAFIGGIILLFLAPEVIPPLIDVISPPKGPYPVRPPEPIDPEVPGPIWPKDPPEPVKPSPPIEPGPPYYDPEEPWPT